MAPVSFGADGATLMSTQKAGHQSTLSSYRFRNSINDVEQTAAEQKTNAQGFGSPLAEVKE